MSFEDAVGSSQGIRYEEEDTSSTTPRELRGWYSYAIAAEVFAVVGVGTCATLLYSRYECTPGVWPFTLTLQ